MSWFSWFTPKPEPRKTKLVLAYKDHSSIPGIYHAGLGVTALGLSKVIGREAVIWPVANGHVLWDRLSADPEVTHVAMLAPWVDTPFLRRFTAAFPHVQFTITCHSNIGFLQIDPYSTGLVREEIELEADRKNFVVSGNSMTFCEFVVAAYNAPCTYLPNLYPLTGMKEPRLVYSGGGPLRIGIFGATRVLKNMGTAVAASVIIANRMQVDTEIWVNGKREESGKSVLDACRQWVKDVPRIKLVVSDWQTWPQFGATVRHMNLMLQPSFTESFNNVTADGIFQGVPVAVSHAIDWAPKNWQANADDAGELARVALRLLSTPGVAKDGQEALAQFTKEGLTHWRKWLEK